MQPLTSDMILVMLFIGVAVFLFVVEWVRVDVVAILIMVALPLAKLVTPAEAFSGLSSNAVVSIIAVIIIGAGLDKTGLVNNLVSPVLRIAGQSANRVIIGVSITVAGISSFMQNIGAAALFLPAIQRISKKLGIPISKLLMPIGFSAILGGTLTLVGCSPLILLNDLLAPFNLEPFGLFDVTPIGAALVAAGIATFMLLGRFILPSPKQPASDSDDGEQDESPTERLGELWELHTPPDFTHYRDPVRVEDLRTNYLVNVVAVVEPPDFKIISPQGTLEVHSDVDLAVFGRREDVERLADEEGITLKPAVEVFADELAAEQSGTVEAVVAPRSNFIGKTLRDVEFEDRFQVTLLTLGRQDETFRAEIESIPLLAGDVLELHGTWRRLQFLQRDRNLLLATPVDVELVQRDKAALAGLWLAVALTMVMVFKLQLSVCLMTGAIGMVVTRVLTIDEAYRAVDWRTVFLLGGLIPLGIATEQTGAASWIAHTILGAIGDVPPIVLITVIGALSTFFTLVISNVGATVLLVPLVVNMANVAGTDPRMAALAVGLATSNSFILPTHQVNALYMGPGHYRSTDFIKAGTVVTLVFLVVMVAMMAIVYGI
ncbi:MAG: SLC13 family permease [Deltaproteobacteria bacterium]|jgi:di/tricarboxylate transporter|nr:SLC13 family permease [Deltaproteobacteria bacterium]MBW2532976.1 SLC13 family permease [Deltaproteobacteria bacterium]